VLLVATLAASLMAVAVREHAVDVFERVGATRSELPSAVLTSALEDCSSKVKEWARALQRKR